MTAQKSNPTIYSGRAWKFNTGDMTRGENGLVTVPAGASDVLTAEDLKHPYAKHHYSVKPIDGVVTVGPSGLTSDDFAALQARLDGVTADRDEQAKANKALTEERDALAVALSQTPDERVKDLEARLAAAAAETEQVRGQLAKAQSGGKGK